MHTFSQSTVLGRCSRKKRRDFERLMNGGKVVEKDEVVAKGGRVVIQKRLLPVSPLLTSERTSDFITSPMNAYQEREQTQNMIRLSMAPYENLMFKDGVCDEPFTPNAGGAAAYMSTGAGTQPSQIAANEDSATKQPDDMLVGGHD